MSLVIDDHIVLPADEFLEPPLVSPSETTASSASNSTTSLEDTIDPRHAAHHHVQIHEHQDPVHHSVPLPSPLPSASPTKHTGHTLTDSPVIQAPNTTSASGPQLYDPPQSATRTFLDPFPTSAMLKIPQFASAAPIYASEPEQSEAGDEDFSTYVGGMSGSGVDDVDQTGSLGYPSSLGASYMESYMQSRPWSVRMAAADEADWDNDDDKESMMKERVRHEHGGVDAGLAEDADEGMDVIGSMEGV